MNLLKNIKSSRFFYRILSLLLAMASVLFLMAFSFMRSYISQSYEQRANDSAVQFLNTASEYVDLALLDLGQAMQQILWNTDITAAILIPDEVSYNRKVEIVKVLSTLEQDYPLVERASLLTYLNETLYDASGNILSMKDAEQRVFLARYHSGVQARTISNGSFTTTVLTMDGQIAILQEFPTPEENGAILVELNEQTLFQFLEKTLTETHAYLEILDPVGASIASFGTPEGTIQKAITMTGSAGWTFLIYPQTNQTHMTTAGFLQLTGMWLLMFGTVSVLTALLVSFFIYRPVHELRSAVEDEDDRDSDFKKENELDMVRRVYENTLQQKTSLSLRVEEMAPIVRDRLYKNLLMGREMTESYLMDRLAYLNSPFAPNGTFLVITGSQNETDEGNPDEIMVGLYHDLSQNRPVKENTSFITRECLLMDDYLLCILFSFGEQASSMQIKTACRELTHEIQGYLHRSNLQDSVILGFGQPCHGLLNLHYSYKEAMEDLNYRQYHGVGMEEASPSTSGNYQQMLDLAVSGDSIAAKRSLEISIQNVYQSTASPEERQESYSHLLNSILEALLELHVPEEKLQLFEPYYQQSKTLPEKERKDLVLGIGKNALNLLASYGQKNRNRYIVRAQKFIQERCTDSHLSLDMVAENIGITAAYLSRLFYELCDINFVNYVNECRVEHAKLLLRQSKMPVQEVGFRSGFNSLQNFNRVFKKHTGTTPGAYRKQEEIS